MISEVPEAAAVTPTKTTTETTTTGGEEFTELSAGTATAGRGVGQRCGETRAPRRVARRSNARSETVKENGTGREREAAASRRRQAAERRVLKERAEDDDDGFVRYRARGA